MDEYLYFRLCLGADVAHRLKGNLPGQHHPAKAQGLQCPDAIQVVHRHLGAGMHGKLRHSFPDNPCRPQVLHQHRIRPCLIEEAQVLLQLRQLPAVHDGIHCHMHMDAPEMGKADGLPHALLIKIVRIGTGPKHIACQIDSIRTAFHCRY